MTDGKAPRAPSAPSDLVARGRGRRFWREVQTEYELDLDDGELLAEVCRQLDQLDALRQIVAADGLVIEARSGPRTHPAAVEARLTRIEVRRGLAQLALPSLDDAESGQGELPPDVASFRTARARKAARARWSNGGV